MQGQDVMPLLWLLGSIALVIVLARCRDLRRVIWLARVPVALAVIALVALAVPEQTQFLVAGVQTGRQGRAKPDITGHSVFADESLPNPPGPRPEGLAAWLRLALACLPFRWPVLVPLLLFFLAAVVSVQGGWTWPSLVASWFGAAPT